ncbi:hypothetical protein NM688_g4365 [Phlebia brevispora]|uniref:Uncharacterized protein n=1 Tax=Phlebia brevispora TaxID=194682 RepID=A0ACC1T346_9APHY|nr:hypothetical protein NM688_g4365 [Phlebia brevispora]
MSDACIPHHDWFTSLLTGGLCTGIFISYLPQHLRIILAKSSEGFSPWFLLLGSLSSASGMLNIIVKQWSIIKCCRVFSVGTCIESTAGIFQLTLQWFMFTMIMGLYMLYYPSHLKYATTDADLHDSRPPLSAKTAVKRDEWRLSIILSWVVFLYTLLVTAVTFFLLAAYPSPDISGQERKLSLWATFLGVTSTMLAAFQYLPQIAHTYRHKLVGALSIGMMLIQTPGAVLMVMSIALRPGTNWTTWSPYAMAGILQGTLLVMCLFWRARQQRLGIDDFGNPLVPTEPSMEESASDAPGQDDVASEESIVPPIIPAHTLDEHVALCTHSLVNCYSGTLIDAMASLVAILDLKGKPLIQRSYRDDVPPSYIEKFLPIILELEEDGQQWNDPVFPVLALSKRNSNAAEIILFLHRLIQVLIEYFKELEEESIRDNFVIIYELLDEMMDFGFPQTTESKILQEYITQESYKLEAQVRPPIAVTNAVSWRSEGIRYRKNEVFLDVIESVNLLVNANGNVVRSEILGAVKMKCYLSGMPELRLGLNDKVMFESTGRTARGKAIEMEDVKFHQCVRLSRFENDRTISFIPPDGEFELMSYRLSTPVKPLVWVEAAVEYHKGSRVEYMVKVKAQFKRRSTANNVEIYVPVPDDADTPKFRASTGSVQYAPDKSAFVWKIKQLGGGREFLMRAHFGLPSVRGEQDNMDKRAPITVKFEIPYFTVSGIQVRYLKIVEKSGYQALPWVRYITQNGDDYSLRTAHEKGSAPIVPL